jgi:hypothetical protein
VCRKGVTRCRHARNETIAITTEQINDLPLLLRIVEELRTRQRIDAQIRPPGSWQGISGGTLVRSWRCHLLLLERAHRLLVVRDGAAARAQTLTDLLGGCLRPTALRDDRLATVLPLLRPAAEQTARDEGLGGTGCAGTRCLGGRCAWRVPASASTRTPRPPTGCAARG